MLVIIYFNDIFIENNNDESIIMKNKSIKYIKS